MAAAIITESGGLIGSEAVGVFHAQGFDVVGVDNDMRSYYFGREASTAWKVAQLQAKYPRYRHCSIDIRDESAIASLFGESLSRARASCPRRIHKTKTRNVTMYKERR